ncbi:MAG: hypothetical protein ACRC2T_11105, partial [Thermoguttaceae bacterium]
MLSSYLILSFVFGITIPEGGVPLLPDNQIGAFDAVTQNPYGSIRKIAPEDEATREHGFKEVLRCEITSRPPLIWNFNPQFRVPGKIQKDEVLLVRFYARTVSAKTESGLGLAQPVFEKAGQPYTKSLDKTIE